MSSAPKVRLGILGGSSQIARSLLPLLTTRYSVSLYSRNPTRLEPFLRQYPGVLNCPLTEFGRKPMQVILNSIGCGDPSILREIGAGILDVTERYDRLVLDHLGPQTLAYIYLSSVAVYGPVSPFPVDPDKPAECPPDFFYGIAKRQAEERHASHGGPISDLRIFGYASDQMDLNSGFLIAGMLRSLRQNTPFIPKGTDSARDYIGAPELASVIGRLAAGTSGNTRIDVVSKQYTTRNRLLRLLQARHGLNVQWNTNTDSESLPVHGCASLMNHESLIGIRRGAEEIVSEMTAASLK